MQEYLKWDEKNITDFSEANITSMYNQGYVFTRKEKGLMQQTRSVRIDLSTFDLSSENRRILKKTNTLSYTLQALPYTLYHWSIGKLAKDFYDTKFGDGTFSANKVKELLTDEMKSNFNKLLKYEVVSSEYKGVVGYAICYENPSMLHYSYPFYEIQSLKSEVQNLGMAMMLRAILYAKENKKQHIYLGSAQRPTDTYKLQFKGLEWFDGKQWQKDQNKLKEVLQILH